MCDSIPITTAVHHDIKLNRNLLLKYLNAHSSLSSSKLSRTTSTSINNCTSETEHWNLLSSQQVGRGWGLYMEKKRMMHVSKVNIILLASIHWKIKFKGSF